MILLFGKKPIWYCLNVTENPSVQQWTWLGNWDIEEYTSLTACSLLIFHKSLDPFPVWKRDTEEKMQEEWKYAVQLSVFPVHMVPTHKSLQELSQHDRVKLLRLSTQVCGMIKLSGLFQVEMDVWLITGFCWTGRKSETLSSDFQQSISTQGKQRSVKAPLWSWRAVTAASLELSKHWCCPKHLEIACSVMSSVLKNMLENPRFHKPSTELVVMWKRGFLIKLLNMPVSCVLFFILFQFPGIESLAV